MALVQAYFICNITHRTMSQVMTGNLMILNHMTDNVSEPHFMFVSSSPQIAIIFTLLMAVDRPMYIECWWVSLVVHVLVLLNYVL